MTWARVALADEETRGLLDVVGGSRGFGDDSSRLGCCRSFPAWRFSAEYHVHIQAGCDAPHLSDIRALVACVLALIAIVSFVRYLVVRSHLDDRSELGKKRE